MRGALSAIDGALVPTEALLTSNPLMQLRVVTAKIEALEPQTEVKVGCRPVLTLQEDMKK